MEQEPAKDVNKLVALWTSIYKQKVLTVVIFVFFLGIVSFFLESIVHANEETLPWWLLAVPLRSFGDALIVAAMVGFLYEWIVRNESEEKLREIISGMLNNQTTELSTRVRNLILTDPRSLAKFASPSERQGIIQAALQAELGDDQLGREIYDCSVRRALSYTERWQNYRCVATLAEIRDPAIPEDIRDAYYHCYYDIRYDTSLNQRRLMFTCVPTIEEYNTLLADPSCEMCWLFPVPKGTAFAAEAGFVARNVFVGDLELNIDTPPGENNEARIVYVADHPELQKDMGRVVTIRYHIDVRVKKRGHLLTLNFVYPTKSISMEIDVTDTEIGLIMVRDFFSSDRHPTIRYLPDLPSPAAARKITVEIRDWVFPKGGVDFIWTLRSERRVRAVQPIPSAADTIGKTITSDDTPRSSAVQVLAAEGPHQAVPAGPPSAIEVPNAEVNAGRVQS